ncbi:MAG: MoxR family ATPase [Agathobacter sp.]|nr:MoxR family ATPase [Agathobacter sp.]
MQTEISNEDLNKALTILNKINGYMDSKVVGQQYLKYSLMVSLVTNGHILLESVPGLAKTTAAKTLTEAINGEFSRVQCTPDLLPSDIIGTQVYNMATNTFETNIGPVNANFLLLDEINRSSSKTQSAMLEAMQERKITIGGLNYDLPKPFVVIATQNPVEQEGTYTLAEAQLDRFLLKVKLSYPDSDNELEILNRIENDVFMESHSVVNLDDIVFLQKLCKDVYMDESIKKYIVNIVQATRMTDKILPLNLAQYVEMGASTRAVIAFMEVAKAVALLNGRSYCTPDDVKAMRYSVLGHRIMLNYAAIADGVKEETIIDAIIGAVHTP